ncbi:MAG: hypothetical protein CM1200mP22_17170 [Dehalococcoidia bacterium]|nr:MAG: hypothetical protein CM1200mP22_17170 [Dehalococcoidia bacterium]
MEGGNPCEIAASYTVGNHGTGSFPKLLTAKPVMVSFNAGESEEPPTLLSLGVSADIAGGLGEVGLCAKLEEDLALMDPDEAVDFREAMGLDEPAVERVKQVCYDTVGLVSFLRVWVKMNAGPGRCRQVSLLKWLLEQSIPISPAALFGQKVIAYEGLDSLR